MTTSKIQASDREAIPFVDLLAQDRSIEDEVMDAVRGDFSTAQFVLGPEVTAFEALFADHVSVDRALGVNSGTSALHLGTGEHPVPVVPRRPIPSR